MDELRLEFNMPIYYVNKNAQPNGDHEVHDSAISGCPTPAQPHNRLDLGYHSDCHSAVREAKTFYAKSDGCAHCCPECHTR